jgi:hypothetical protein
MIGPEKNARKGRRVEGQEMRERMKIWKARDLKKLWRWWGGGEKALVINFKGERKRRVWETHRKLFKEETDN